MKEKQVNILPSKRESVLRTVWKQKVSWLMMLPFLALFTFITIIPAIVSIVLSFFHYNMFQTPVFAGLDNFINLFLNDSVFITSLSNTLVYAVITGLGGYLLSFAVAWIINDLPDKLRAFVTLVFYAPSISGAATAVFTILFSSDGTGYVNAWLLKLGVISTPILWFQDPELALGMVIAVQLWLSLGVGFLSFVAGLKNVDRTLYESAALDGVRNRFQELWYITLPGMRPMLLFGAVTQITGAFSGGALVTALCGNPSVDYSAHTLLLHASDYAGTRLEMGYAAAVSIVLFALIMFTYKFCTLLLSRVGK